MSGTGQATRVLLMLALLFTAALIAMSAPAAAQLRTLKTGEDYTPGIWIDPDGCEHWVMDDGQRGFMTPNTLPDGRPVCRDISICAVLPSDTLFKGGSATLTEAGRARAARVFADRSAKSYAVAGYSDSVGARGANARLSAEQAAAVAQVGRAGGARITEVRGHGEGQPVASNATSGGRAANRRIEIICTR